MRIVGICGKAGSGKSTLADFLVNNHGYVCVSFADPLKRICRDVYDFTDEQLWGPSEKRNAGDPRYPRPGRVECDPLTPRYALQRLGTEWGRDCYGNTWRDLAIRTAKKLLSGNHFYDHKGGLHVERDWSAPKGIVIPDVRFLNEVDGINGSGGYCVRIRRGTTVEGASAQHLSETELEGIDPTNFLFEFDNAGTLMDLEGFAAVLVGEVDAHEARIEREGVPF